MPYIDAINIGFPYNAIAMCDFWLPEVRVVAVFFSVHRNGGALLVDTLRTGETPSKALMMFTQAILEQQEIAIFWGLVFCLFVFLHFGFCFFCCSSGFCGFLSARFLPLFLCFLGFLFCWHLSFLGSILQLWCRQRATHQLDRIHTNYNLSIRKENPRIEWTLN